MHTYAKSLPTEFVESDWNKKISHFLVDRRILVNINKKIDKYLES